VRVCRALSCTLMRSITTAADRPRPCRKRRCAPALNQVIERSWTTPAKPPVSSGMAMAHNTGRCHILRPGPEVRGSVQYKQGSGLRLQTRPQRFSKSDHSAPLGAIRHHAPCETENGLVAPDTRDNRSGPRGC
jgi:hypothetical protein